MRTYGMDEIPYVETLPIGEKSKIWLANPWLLSQKPFKITDDVYYVGTSWVSVYLVKTDAGLVLLDCAMVETFYQVVDNIRAMGFDPHDIKKLLLTHGHFDHCGAARMLQELSGCETWISQYDAYFFTERRDLIAMEDHVPEFKIDHYYDYDQVIDCGNIQFRPVHCPGHTPGTTSLFFNVQQDGKTYTCGIHGGLGSGVLSKKMLDQQKWPYETQQIYLKSLDKVMNEKVDILILSHAKHAVKHDILAIAASDDGSGKGFIDPDAWRRMIQGKKEEMLKMIAEGR